MMNNDEEGYKMIRRHWLKKILAMVSIIFLVIYVKAKILAHFLVNWLCMYYNFVLRDDDPAQVVRSFLEAWHKSDTKTLYALLDTKTKKYFPFERLQYAFQYQLPKWYKPTVLWVRVAKWGQNYAFVDFAVRPHPRYLFCAGQKNSVLDTSKDKGFGFGIPAKDIGFFIFLGRYKLVKETDGWKITNAIGKFYLPSNDSCLTDKEVF